MSDENLVVESEYEIIPLDNVLAYYAKDFTAKNGEIVSREFYVDQHKGVVVFRLYVKRPTPAAPDLPLACARGNHYTNDGDGRSFDYCPDCGKPVS